MRKLESHSISAGHSVAIIGFGIEGQSAIDYSRSRNAGNVVVYDLKEREAFHAATIQAYERAGVIFHFRAELTHEEFANTDWVIRSPGVNPHSLPFGESSEKVTSTTNIFLETFSRENIIGVTGTKGKGTTSTLITEMFKAAGVDAYLGGNIGIPPLTFIDQLTRESRVVLEMSSFQLMDLARSPHIAVVLMTTIDHLDWHATEEEYVLAKAQLVTRQSKDDVVIVNRDYASSRRIGEMAPSQVYWISTKGPVERGCYVEGDEEDGWLVFVDGKKKEKIIPLKKILIPGRHNWENAAAAACAARISGVIKRPIAKVLREFKGLEHRLELIREVNGVRYYNDSFSTVPETVIAAIRAFKEQKVLLLGGSTKHSDFTELGDVIAGDPQIKAIIAIGPESDRIKKAIDDRRPDITYVETAITMKEAVQEAYKLAQPGWVVVESPGCASFAWHKNYKERGREFKEAVNQLV